MPRWAAWAPYRLALVCGLGACHSPTAGTPTQQVPEQVFILHDVRLEERRAGQLLWQGHAERSAGSLSVTDVARLTLVRIAQTPDEARVYLQADRAHLDLGGGLADFCPIIASDDAGRRLVGTAATYNEAEKKLWAKGPIVFTAPNMHLAAEAATLCLGTGALIFDGPVLGRIDPEASPPEQKH